MTQRAAIALTDREPIPRLSRLEATQSVFFAMIDLCQRRSPSYRPAEAALRAVRAGEYRADLGAPEPCRPARTSGGRAAIAFSAKPRA